MRGYSLHPLLCRGRVGPGDGEPLEAALGARRDRALHGARGDWAEKGALQRQGTHGLSPLSF